jgi:hypothetical protein
MANNEYIVSAAPEQLDNLQKAIDADPHAELLSAGGPAGRTDRLVVKLSPSAAALVELVRQDPATVVRLSPSPTAAALAEFVREDTAIVEPNVELNLDTGGE